MKKYLKTIFKGIAKPLAFWLCKGLEASPLHQVTVVSGCEMFRYTYMSEKVKHFILSVGIRYCIVIIYKFCLIISVSDRHRIDDLVQNLMKQRQDVVTDMQEKSRQREVCIIINVEARRGLLQYTERTEVC